jgi:IPT/TIG domain
MRRAGGSHGQDTAAGADVATPLAMAIAAACAVLCAFAVIASAPAHAQVYPPRGCTLGANVSVANGGESITVTGAAFDPGQVAIHFDEPLVTTTAASSQGTIAVTISVPPSASAGTHVIRAVPADGKCDPSTTITVRTTAADRGEESSGALPFTGSDALPLVWIALALLTVGTAFVLAFRRKAQTRRALSS